MRDFLSKKVVSLKPSGIRKFFDIASEIEGAISLGVGEPDFDTPWHIREEGIYSLERGRTYYTSNSGLKELRIEITKYTERKINVKYDPLSQVLVTVYYRQRLQAFAQHGHFHHVNADFARLRTEHVAFHANEVSQVEELLIYNII